MNKMSVCFEKKLKISDFFVQICTKIFKYLVEILYKFLSLR